MRFTKILTISLIATFLSLGGLTAFALTEQETAAINDFIKTLESQQDCVNEDEAKSGKIIQFIEEPFSDPGDVGSGENTFTLRDCFRNVLQYTIVESNGAKTARTMSSVDKTCATKLADDVDSGNNNLNAKFTCQPIQVVLGPGGTSFLFGYIGILYRWAAGLVGIIAVTVIIFSGIQITISGGDSEVIGKAKSRIIKSFSGIAVLFLSALILNTVNPNFFTG